MKDAYGNAIKTGRKDGKMVIYESQILGVTLYVALLTTAASANSLASTAPTALFSQKTS